MIASTFEQSLTLCPEGKRTMNNMAMALRLLCVILATVSGTSEALAATFIVDTMQDSLDVVPGDGICADGGGACSLRAAIQEANALAGSDEIVLGAGIFTLSIPGALEDAGAAGDLDITSEVSISGADEQTTIIDGAALDRVLDVHASGVLRLERLTVRNGLQATFNSNDAAEFSGAGVLIRAGGSLTMNNVTIRDNASKRDGAGISVYGSLQAVGLHLLQNVADQFSSGGALFIGSTATLLNIDQCELSGNSAVQGGAIYSVGANPGIQVTRCLIAENHAKEGAGIFANLGSTHWLLRNVTISGNDADGDGGAIFADGANQLRFEHATITANSADGAGGAIVDVRGSASAGFIPIEFINSIVWGNTQSTGDECNTVFADVIVSSGATLHGPGNACRMRAGVGDITTNAPGLGALGENGGATRTHALVAMSAAIDSAQTANCASTDQRGQARPYDGNGDGVALCDIGAFELVPDRIFAADFE
jgi:CSLREA domain-containing protein